MCLAIPMQLTAIDGPRGTVDTGGVRCEVRLDLVEAPRVGDYVLVHAGYAIGVLDPAEAAETLALLAELGAVDPEPGT
jgi:hydrogenase expression/formation protein HypC